MKALTWVFGAMLLTGAVCGCDDGRPLPVGEDQQPFLDPGKPWWYTNAPYHVASIQSCNPSNLIPAGSRIYDDAVLSMSDYWTGVPNGYLTTHFTLTRTSVTPIGMLSCSIPMEALYSYVGTTWPIGPWGSYNTDWHFINYDSRGICTLHPGAWAIPAVFGYPAPNSVSFNIPQGTWLMEVVPAGQPFPLEERIETAGNNCTTQGWGAVFWGAS